MIQKIRNCRELKPYLRNEISDEGITVGISKQVEKEKMAAVKVDDYYAGLRLAAPPKAIDFLVVVDCECDAFVMYLLELKNVSAPKFLLIRDIHEKFQNTIDDFLSRRFGYIFLDDKYKYKEILLYLVSDAYGLGGKYTDFNEYRKIRDKIDRKDSLKTEISLGAKMFRFKGRILKISFDIPPNPIIRRIL